MFAPVLVNHDQIFDTAQQIIEFRNRLQDEPVKNRLKVSITYKLDRLTEFFGSTSESAQKKFVKNLFDYGDNAIRYFRLTGFINIRGNGFYIDLEPRRSVELEALLKSDNGESIEFASREVFQDFISNPSTPSLPWDTADKHEAIILNLRSSIQDLELKLKESISSTLDYSLMTTEERLNYIASLRERRLSLMEIWQQRQSRDVGEIKLYIEAIKTYSTLNNDLSS